MGKDIFQEMVEAWPSKLVGRTEVGVFSGGMLNCKTLANLDSRKLGPEKIRIGRKIGYPTDSLVEWMRARSSKN